MTRSHQSSGHCQRELWRAESPGHHGVELIDWFKNTDVGTHHGHTFLPTETTNDAFQEIRAFGSAIEQGDPGNRQVEGDHQSGGTTASAEVEDGLDRSILDERSNKPTSVSDHLIDRSRSQET